MIDFTENEQRRIKMRSPPPTMTNSGLSLKKSRGSNKSRFSTNSKLMQSSLFQVIRNKFPSNLGLNEDQKATEINLLREMICNL